MLMGCRVVDGRVSNSEIIQRPMFVCGTCVISDLHNPIEQLSRCRLKIRGRDFFGLWNRLNECGAVKGVHLIESNNRYH